MRFNKTNWLTALKGVAASILVTSNHKTYWEVLDVLLCS